MGNDDGWDNDSADGGEVTIRIQRLNGELYVSVKRLPSGMEFDSGPLCTTYGTALDWVWRKLTDDGAAQGRPLGRPE